MQFEYLIMGFVKRQKVTIAKKIGCYVLENQFSQQNRKFHHHEHRPQFYLNLFCLDAVHFLVEASMVKYKLQGK